MPAPSEVHKLLKEEKRRSQRMPVDSNGGGPLELSEEDLELLYGTQSLSASSASSADSSDSSLFSSIQQNSATIQQKFSRNLSLEIREWVEMCPGRFAVADLDKELEIKTRQAKNTRAKNLELLCKSRIIERFGVIRGHYQIVDKDCPLINFINVEKTQFDLVLPFNLNRLYLIQPKNIIVIAGDSNAGKTAFMLYTLYLTINNNLKTKRSMICNYYSSEMEDAEWHNRLSKTGIELEWWAQNFNLYKRSENFHQVINPNALNFIDYLEVHEDFYRVGGMIKAIFDRLENGVAIITLQKNKGAELGLGGGRGIEKARLYLTIREDDKRGNVIKIEKGKNAIGKNRVRQELDFSIIDSWKLVGKGDWMRVEEPENKWRR